MARISSTAYQLCYLLVVTGILQCMFSQVVAEDTHSPVIKFLPGFRGPLPFRIETGSATSLLCACVFIRCMVMYFTVN